MNAFDLHRTITQKYEDYLRSFIHISDDRILERVNKELDDGKLVPQPLVQLNPNFARNRSLDQLVEEEDLAPELTNIFRGYDLYTHQVGALQRGARGEGFVVTSGTGSGKSVTFLGTVFNYVLKHRQPGLKAILIYPMNALIASQAEEIGKYAKAYEEHTGQAFPIRYATYTGTTPQREREAILADPPDVLLTNYMMLELIMTRHGERSLRENLAEHLKYLVFDELHTYRGRQGADVSLLIRRIRAWVRRKRPLDEVLCLGTSATMSTEGTLTEQKGKVAEVAGTIFGQRVTPDQVIIETLEPSTAQGPLPTAEEIRRAVEAGIDPAAGEAVLKEHATARWLEQDVGMEKTEHGYQRGKPQPWSTLVQQLAAKVEVTEARAGQHLQDLLQWAESVNAQLREAKIRRGYLGVRLHQFISQTSNVYITLEPANQRQISLEKERLEQQEDEVPMYPVFFSRLSGYEFVGVHAYDDSEKDAEKQWRLEPREMDQLKAQKTGTWGDGYLLIHRDGEEDLWDEKRDLDILPSSWKTDPKTKAPSLVTHYKNRLPRQIYFDKQGRWSQEARYPHRGWFVPYKFPYDPTAKVVQGGRRNENTRLMRLGNAGRSTTTSLITLEVLRTLIHAEVPSQQQKLLSFTDNRQDASLQAGHFNDFLMILRLRSALFQALKKADRYTLTLKELAEAVCTILKLPEVTYAYRPTTEEALPNRYNVEALTDYIRYRLLYDVTSGWRINLPNLEQTGLMKLGYEGLQELSNREGLWAGLEGLAGVPASVRLQRLQVTLNFFRMHYALDYYQLEDKNYYYTLQEKLRQQLDPEKLWSLDHREKLRVPGYIVMEALKETKNPVQSAGKNSRLHRYWKRMWQQDAREGEAQTTQGKNRPKYEDFILELFNVLERLHLISKTTVKGKRENRIQEVAGYQLASSRLMWTLGDGTVSHDPLRVEALAEYTPRINPFFKALYQQDFAQYPPLWEGREHTGQVSGGEREVLEDRFRKGELAAMYCSPTMELGIDISSLDIVHLRNVPPNPANYA
ncbi:MAG TPA: DEAD/DEAH box helicase, partial [Cytophagales bacterium]|nr:DEAD/DEAH box helicase [Cytophagales bacterium]